MSTCPAHSKIIRINYTHIYIFIYLEQLLASSLLLFHFILKVIIKGISVIVDNKSDQFTLPLNFKILSLSLSSQNHEESCLPKQKRRVGIIKKGK